MAKQTRLSTITTTCTLLIFLICCHEIVQVQGRHLKSGQCKKCARHPHENTLSAAKVSDHNSGSGLVRAAETKTSKVEHVTDDFRPTAPGHSPGVGHSIKN